MAKIVGIGIACLDHLNIIDEYPSEDETCHITQISTQGGGLVATALVACSRLGHETHYLGTLGNDGIGKQIVDELESENVRCHIEYKDMVSAHSELMIYPQNSTRTKFVFMSTDPELSFTQQQIELIESADAIHIDGTNYASALKAIEIAKQKGIVISLDAEHCFEDLERNRNLASLVDLLIMSKRNALTVSGKATVEEAVEYFGPMGAKVVIATCGAEGCVCWRDGKIVHYPAYKVKAIDTTGAGDVFHGAFLTAYLNHYDFDTCVRYASYVAAQKCTKIGGRTGIVTSVDLSQL